MSEVNISINTRNEIEGKVSTKQKINANIYPRGPQGPKGEQGPKGDTGNGIASIEKTDTVGLVDTYTITFTNGSTFNFTVTNANAGNTYTKSEIEQFLAQKVNISDIINTLTSDETNKPLSAKQGKVLKGLIDNTYTSSEIDTFLSTINGNITTINSNISSLNDTKLEKTNVSDVYDSTSTYAVGDYCIYENTLYKCTTAISTAEEFDSSKWTVASISYEFKRITNELSNKLNSNKVIQENGTVSTSNVYSSKAIQNILDKINPVGTIKMTTVNTNPGTYLPGTWVAWGSGRVPVGVDTSQTEFNTVEKTGGEKTHQLTVDEMPSHNHYITVKGKWSGLSNEQSEYFNISTEWGKEWTSRDWINYSNNSGGNQSHNNLQPYITCYMWKRTA